MWMTEGSLEPIAEQMFSELNYDRLLLEWEDPEREGDYTPLRHVPAYGPIVVMGIISSKDMRVETVDELEERMDEISAFVPLEQLAISPQCGFASTWQGNELAEESQWRKIETLVEASDRLWGR
jgi:5-methyltetrahydropteroyltriglutamate--homocysteine methyltransferase